MPSLKYRIAGFFLRRTSEKGQFENVLKTAIDIAKKTKCTSLVQVAVQENVLLQKYRDLTSQARSLVHMKDLSNTESVEILRSIFNELQTIKQQLKQYRKSRGLLNNKNIRDNNFFLRELQYHHFMQNYTNEKLCALSRPSPKKMTKKAMKLKIQKERVLESVTEIESALKDDSETDVVEENENEENENDGFSMWLKDLVEKSECSESLEHIILREEVTVSDLEARLKALRAL